MVDRSERILRRMLEVVDAVREGKVTLVAAADALHFHSASLEGFETEWAEQLGKRILDLESAGLASEAQRSEMGAEFTALRLQALAAIEDLVLEILARRI